MLITMFTDASFCPEFNISAYAVWAKTYGRDTFRYSGMLRTNVADNNFAETYAVINGVFAVLHVMQPPPGSKIIAQTDSESAIQILSKQHGLTKMVNAKLTKHEIQIEYRHVKGHKGYKTPRNSVNTWCDREAIRLLRAARAELRRST